jgi:hypothetical protein
MIIIHKPARRILNDFWMRYPEKRKACTRKYGFDPILQEEQYWIPGIAEKPHRQIRKDIEKNGGVFSVPLVWRWVASEIKQD